MLIILPPQVQGQLKMITLNTLQLKQTKKKA